MKDRIAELEAVIDDLLSLIDRYEQFVKEFLYATGETFLDSDPLLPLD